jgi:hypothetical protein
MSVMMSVLTDARTFTLTSDTDNSYEARAYEKQNSASQSTAILFSTHISFAGWSEIASDPTSACLRDPKVRLQYCLRRSVFKRLSHKRCIIMWQHAFGKPSVVNTGCQIQLRHRPVFAWNRGSAASGSRAGRDGGSRGWPA